MAEGFSPPELDLGSTDTSYYKKLGIDQNASKKDIQKRFRSLAKLYHPDKTRNSATEEAMKDLNKMKSVLLDEVERKKYDEELSTKLDVHVPLFMRQNRGSILLPPAPRHSMEYIQLFDISKQKFQNLPKSNLKKMIQELDQELLALLTSIGSSKKQTQKTKVTLRKKHLRSSYEEVNIAANRYSTVDDVCDYESIKLILERITKISPSISAGNPGDHTAILNTDCASLSDLKKLINLFQDEVPELATKSDLLRWLQKFTPIVIIQNPAVPKHLGSECASCCSKPGWLRKKFSTCYWCNRPFCASCPLEQCHYPRIGGTFHSLCSRCINDLNLADGDGWAQASIQLLHTPDDDSISGSLGCASIAIALGADAHDLLRNIAKQLHSQKKHELAYTVISLDLAEDAYKAMTTQQMKAQLLASSILLSMAKLQNKTFDERMTYALASKEAYLTGAAIAKYTDTELFDNTVNEVYQIVSDVVKEEKHEDDKNVIKHTMALEALWSQRDMPGILTYLKENSIDTSEEKDFLLRAFRSFLQNKEPHLTKMLPEDRHALEFLKAIIKIKENNFREAFKGIEATAWSHFTSSVSDDTIVGTCLHTIIEEKTDLYSFKSLKEILKSGSKGLLFSPPPKKFSMNDRSVSLLFPSESELTPPFEANWSSLSVVGHNTKCHTKYEEAVLKLYKEKKWSRLQVAWAYIDQFQGCDHPAEMVVCYLHAAMWIVSIFHESKVDMMTLYGLKCVVMSLLQKSFAITIRTLNPGMELYVIRLTIGIIRKISQVPEPQFVLSNKDLNLLPLLLKRLEKVSRLFPFWNPPKVSVSEAVMFNIITRKLHSNFMLALQDSQERSPVTSIDLSYQLYENDLRGMLPLNDPIDCRARSMKELLNSQGWSWKDVTALMSSPLTQRDADGWIVQSKSLGVQQQYAEINGFVLNLDPQNPSFQLLVVEANHRRNRLGLISQEDVNTMLRLDSSDYPLFFSLDPPNDDLDKQYHPFQQWRYHTDSAKDTEVLHTMFITDYLMKSFTVGSDVSSVPPFKQRPCKDGLTKHLPPELQNAIRSIHERGGFHSQSHHRFWIEAKEMKYDLQQSGSKIECTFGEMEMIVKSHSLIRRNDGELKDTDEDDDPNSPESKFAEDMTNHYEDLSLYFPQFARLRQLSKLQTVAMMLDSILQNVKEKSEENIKIPKELIKKIQDDARMQHSSKIDTALSDLKREVGEWPKSDNNHYVQSKVEEIETQMRRRIDEEESRLYRIHGYNITIDNSDALQSLRNIRSEVYSALKKNDEDVLDQITSLWKGVMKIRNEYILKQHVRKWLAYKPNLFEFRSKTPQDKLTEHISSYLIPTEEDIYKEFQDHNKQKYQCMANIIRQYKCQPRQVPMACKWVPAAICHESFRVSYGGVAFTPKITPIKETERLFQSRNTIPVSIQPRATAASKLAYSTTSYTSPRGAMHDKTSRGQVNININQTRKVIGGISKGKPAQPFSIIPSHFRSSNSERLNAQMNKFISSTKSASARRAAASSTRRSSAARGQKSSATGAQKASAAGGGGKPPGGGGGGSGGPPSDGQKWIKGPPSGKTIGLYKLTDTKTGKVYIGMSATNINNRLSRHKRDVKKGDKTVGQHFTSWDTIEIQYMRFETSDSTAVRYQEQVQIEIARNVHGDENVINVNNAMAADQFNELSKKY